MDIRYKDKWVRVFCDYSSTPFWGKDGVMLDLEDMPISEFLKGEFMGVACVFEYTHNGGNGHDWAGIELCSKATKYLVKKLKEELPDWTIFYYENNMMEEMK